MEYPDFEFFEPVTNNASNNLLRIAQRIKYLEDLRNSVSQECLQYYGEWPGIDIGTQKKIGNEILAEGFKPRELYEEILDPYEQIAGRTLEQIDTFLLFLSEFKGFQINDISDINDMVGSKLGLENLLLMNGRRTGKLMFDVIIEPYIQWLYNFLVRCRSVRRGIQNVQSHLLNQYYAPGGSFSQQAEPRFFDLASQH